MFVFVCVWGEGGEGVGGRGGSVGYVKDVPRFQYSFSHNVAIHFGEVQFLFIVYMF